MQILPSRIKKGDRLKLRYRHGVIDIWRTHDGGTDESKAIYRTVNAIHTDAGGRYILRISQVGDVGPIGYRTLLTTGGPTTGTGREPLPPDPDTPPMAELGAPWTAPAAAAVAAQLPQAADAVPEIGPHGSVTVLLEGSAFVGGQLYTLSGEATVPITIRKD